MPLFAKDTKEETFWKWFEKNQDDLYHFEKDTEAVFDRLAAAMNKVHDDLTFEFSPVREDGTREFVISAGGIKAAFPSVESLHAAAPKLPRWTILKYRQRRFPINDIEFADRKVKSSDVHYAIFKDDDPKKVGVMIFLDGYTEEDKGSVWGQIGYLFLDEALGEFDVETHVGAIVFFDRDSKYFEHARPIAELPSHFDEKLGRQTDSEQGGGGQAATRSESE
ncbi:MAG: hypothetical protein R3F31_19640 [Verrucomicrobiales bacterium]